VGRVPRGPVLCLAPDIRIPAMTQATGHLLFIWKPSGYELREADGDVPAVGAQIEADDQTLLVNKVAPSPLPNDDRLCAYLIAV
jgi:hypothetical protein